MRRNVLEGPQCWPASDSVDASSRSSNDLCLPGGSRRAHAIQAIKRGASSAHRWQVSANSCGSENLVLERAVEFEPEMHRGEVARILPQVIPLHRGRSATGGFAWSERSREPTLTTDGRLCRRRILSRPLTWSQRQLNSRAREELGEKSILLRSVWRGIPVDALPPNPDHEPVPQKAIPQAERFISWRMGRRIAARVAEH